MDLVKQQRISSGLVSERFPGVSVIIIQMTYFRKGLNPVLMVRTVTILPGTHAYFNMACMISGCTGGGFDLTPVITEMVKKHQKLKKGNLVCNGKIADLKSDHANISYEVNITFNRKKS
ncbi:MAG: hypothetical protein HY806_05995 [Nitrospirae bacterium]|nr:hypothetical protein [Nitrospirota bacterium]